MQGGSGSAAVIAVIIIIVIIIAVVVVVVVIQSNSDVEDTPVPDVSVPDVSVPDVSVPDVSVTPVATDYSTYFDRTTGKWCGGDSMISSLSGITDTNRATALKDCYNSPSCYQVNEVNTYSKIESLGLGSFGNACNGSSSDVLWTKKGPFTSLSDAKSHYSSSNNKWCNRNAAIGDRMTNNDDNLLLGLNACYNDSSCYSVNNLTKDKGGGSGVDLLDTSNSSNSCNGSDGDYLYKKN